MLQHEHVKDVFCGRQYEPIVLNQHHDRMTSQILIACSSSSMVLGVFPPKTGNSDLCRRRQPCMLAPGSVRQGDETHSYISPQEHPHLGRTGGSAPAVQNLPHRLDAHHVSQVTHNNTQSQVRQTIPTSTDIRHTTHKAFA